MAKILRAVQGLKTGFLASRVMRVIERGAKDGVAPCAAGLIQGVRGLII